MSKRGWKILEARGAEWAYRKGVRWFLCREGEREPWRIVRRDLAPGRVRAIAACPVCSA